jgi:hypothetical protein
MLHIPSFPASGADAEARASRPWRRRLLVGVVSSIPFLLAAGLTFVAFFPGHVNGDTAGPYLQAAGHIPVDDWHPTMNVVIYWSLLQLWGHPAVILGFQCLLLWGGLAMAAGAVRRRFPVPTALFFIPIGFLPVVFNYMGALVKDTLSAGFTLVAIALLLFERGATKHRHWLLLGSVVCLWFAYMVKLSALPIVLALMLYITARFVRNRTRSVVLAASGLMTTLLLIGSLLSSRVLDDLVDAQDTNIEHSLQLFDLAGITHFGGTNAFGEDLLPSERVADVVEGVCYDSGTWDPLAWFGECAFISDNAGSIRGADTVSDRWRDAIVDRPLDYVRHRASHLAAFSLRPGTNQFYYDYVDARLDWSPNHNALMDAYDAVNSRTVGWPQRRAIFWQLASLALLGVLLARRWRHRPGPFDAVLIAAMAANVLFYVAWFVIGVSYELRYSYTVIITCLVAVATLLVQAVATRRDRPQVTDPAGHDGGDRVEMSSSTSP